MLRHAGETEGEMEGIKGQRAGERQTGGVLHHHQKARSSRKPKNIYS